MSHPRIIRDDGIIDEIAIELAVMGKQPRLTIRERHEAVRVLYERPWSTGAIAEHLGFHERVIERDKAAMGLHGRNQRETLHRRAA